MDYKIMDDVMVIVNSIINHYGEAIVTVIVAYLAKVVLPVVLDWARQKLGERKYLMAVDFVEKTVWAIEQIAQTNEVKNGVIMPKYMTARNRINSFLAEKGIQLSEEQIEVLIESAVRKLNDEQDKAANDSLRAMKG